MFKINKINGDIIDSTSNISGVVGKTVHLALQVYYGGDDTYIPENESEAIKYGLEAGMNFLSGYNEGWIEYSDSIPNKEKAQEIFAFVFNSYIKEKGVYGQEDIISNEDMLEHPIDLEWKGEKVILPIPLKGKTDKIIRRKDNGRIEIVDYKVVYNFSDPEKIDGAKMIQAVHYFLLAYAEYEEAPYSFRFQEIKRSKNRDGSPQVKEYEIVFEENDLFFDFYFRLYDDMTRAINGEAVFVPNLNDFYDNEVSLISYIHRLDVSEELAQQMKNLKIKNITELLKQKIVNAGNMRKFLKTAEKKFVSGKSLDYQKMTTEERIKVKLMEFGMTLNYDSMIAGNTVDLYKFIPSIGLKMAKLKSYVADVEQVVGVSGIRILAPIPNSTMIGFEIPKKDRKFIEILPEAKGFELAMGVDIMGDVFRFDIRKAPHILVAGATGSGKSVFLNAIISQLSNIPEVELHLYDPKMVELSIFRSKAKHYACETEEIYNALSDLVKDMNNRYRALAEAGVRNIVEYKGEMKYKVIVIDEFGDLVLGDKILEKHRKTGEKYQKGVRAGEEKIEVERINISKGIQELILILAQKARACGIHLIIATQRPSVDIITGSIKANFVTKVAFKTAKAIDSQVLLDNAGAEKLLGKGDMLFVSDEGEIRLQGFSL